MFDIKNIPPQLENFVKTLTFFQYYRIINPDTHKVYDIKNAELKAIKEKCYDIWKRNGPCANCISKQTCSKRKMFLKLEHLDKAIYLIYSLPVDLNGTVYSLELISDITTQMLVNDGFNENYEVMNIIEQFNTAISHEAFTGLYNKNFIINQIESFAGNDLPNLQSFIAVLLDINNFKVINDKFGHYSGDNVIKTVSEILKSFADDKIWVGRLGGDEFFIAFYNCTMQYVEEKCNAVKKELASVKYTKDDVSFSITASVGITEIEYADTVESVIDRLDKELYKEKMIIRSKMNEH